MKLQIIKGGEPTDQEMAAIVSAIEQCWPTPAMPMSQSITPKWRFSGRDW